MSFSDAVDHWHTFEIGWRRSGRLSQIEIFDTCNKFHNYKLFIVFGYRYQFDEHLHTEHSHVSHYSESSLPHIEFQKTCQLSDWLLCGHVLYVEAIKEVCFINKRTDERRL